MSANSVKWEPIGHYIEENVLRVGANTSIAISGVNFEKGFIPTVANMDGIDTSKYKLVPTNHFACNLMHVGRDEIIPIAYNDSPEIIAVSPAYYVFSIKETCNEDLLPRYLEMLLTRNEFGRLAWFHTDGSIRGNLPEKAFHEILIPIPSIEVQQELVDTYNGLKALAEQNEALIEPLSKACEALVIQYSTRNNVKREKVGNLINYYEKINTLNYDLSICGINKNKTFMPTVADTNELNKSKYKLVNKHIFAFSGMQTGRDVCIRIALQEDANEFLISPAYTTFEIKDVSIILPQYFFILFNRFEMDRLGWFLSDGSIRSNLDLDRFSDIELPVPSIEIQRSIVNVYDCMEEAKKIASEAREKLKTLCPALVQRAANS